MRDYSLANDKTVMPVAVGEVWRDNCGRLWLITEIKDGDWYPIMGIRVGEGKTRAHCWLRNGGGLFGFSRLKEKIIEQNL